MIDAGPIHIVVQVLFKKKASRAGSVKKKRYRGELKFFRLSDADGKYLEQKPAIDEIGDDDEAESNILYIYQWSHWLQRQLVCVCKKILNKVERSK